MSIQPYTPPAFNKTAFHCPTCRAFAKQIWCQGYGKIPSNAPFTEGKLKFTICTHCEARTVWYDGTMLFPDTSTAPHPNPDLPEDIASDYEEARSILSRSPRGAAALFRLCIQKLCKHLGESGKNINADIAALVKKGLHPTVQKSLDIVRVIGNEAVHPGTIDLNDQPDTALQLANLINIIADAMISQPKAVDELYGTLPEEKRSQIDQRDGNTGSSNKTSGGDVQ